MDDFGSFSYFRGRRFDIPSPTAKPQAKKPLPRKHEEGSVSDLSDLEGEEGTPTLIPNQFGTFVDFASSTAFLEEFAHLREESQEITKKFSMLRRKTLHNNSTPGSPQISRHTSEVLVPSAGTLDEFTSLYKQMLIKKNEQIALMQKKEMVVGKKYEEALAELQSKLTETEARLQYVETQAMSAAVEDVLSIAATQHSKIMPFLRSHHARILQARQELQQLRAATKQRLFTMGSLLNHSFQKVIGSIDPSSRVDEGWEEFSPDGSASPRSQDEALLLRFSAKARNAYERMRSFLLKKNDSSNKQPITVETVLEYAAQELERSGKSFGRGIHVGLQCNIGGNGDHDRKGKPSSEESDFLKLRMQKLTATLKGDNSSVGRNQPVPGSIVGFEPNQESLHTIVDVMNAKLENEDIMSFNPEIQEAVQAVSRQSKALRQETTRTAFQSVIQRVKAKKELEIIQSQYGYHNDDRHMNEIARDDEELSRRIIPHHAYCHVCGSGPFCVLRIYNCERCYTRLVRKEKSIGFSDGSSAKHHNPEEDARFAYFFAKAIERTTKREEDLRRTKEEIKAKRAHLFFMVSDVVQSIGIHQVQQQQPQQKSTNSPVVHIVPNNTRSMGEGAGGGNGNRLTVSSYGMSRPMSTSGRGGVISLLDILTPARPTSVMAHKLPALRENPVSPKPQNLYLQKGVLIGHGCLKRKEPIK